MGKCSIRASDVLKGEIVFSVVSLPDSTYASYSPPENSWIF